MTLELASISGSLGALMEFRSPQRAAHFLLLVMVWVLELAQEELAAAGGLPNARSPGEKGQRHLCSQGSGQRQN